MSNKTFHVYLGERRTTVSLTETLSGLLAIKLGHTPETEEAHAAVREWLQEQLDEQDDPGRTRVSQWLQAEVLLFMVDNKLSSRYLDWFIEEY